MTYERLNIQRSTGYQPGEQPDDPSVVKLNTNENPYPPADAVMAALRSFPADRLRRYPSPRAEAFRRTAGKMHGLEPANVIATNGGDELLRLVITTFVEPGKPIGAAEPSYSLYPVLAEIHDSPFVSIPLEDDWSLPADFATQLNRTRASLAFVVNPHAPSGRLTPVDQLAKIADTFSGVLVVDEAYVDFVDPNLAHDAVQLVRQFDNVLLLRTLSKGYSLAGLRFAYGLGTPGLIQPMLEKTKDSYNTDTLAQALATAALESRTAAAKTWQAVRAERARLTAELTARGFQIPPSQSNFILARPTGKRPDAGDLYQMLKGKGVFVRYFDQDRLRDKLRITIGSPRENDALLTAIDSHD